MNQVRLFSLLLYTGFLIVMRCTGATPTHVGNDTNGGGIETVASIRGTIVDSTDTPAPCSYIALRQVDYISSHPDSFIVLDTFTGADGAFSIPMPPSGVYRLEVDARNGSYFTSEYQIDSSDTVFNMGVLHPGNPGSLKIRLMYAYDNRVFSGKAYIFGLDVDAQSDSTGNFSFPKIPAGFYSLRFEPFFPDSQVYELRNVHVRENAVTDLGTLFIIATFIY
jgi:hypothetical protein